MSTWQQFAEVVAAGAWSIVGLVAVGFGVRAVIIAHVVAAPLRKAALPAKAVDRSSQTEEQRKQALERRERQQQRFRAFAEELNLTINPMRRDNVEVVKESSNWGRLGIQYALIANGGALAALPYLLGMKGAAVLSVTDATWSAGWFAGGMLAAMLVCVVAYADLQIIATTSWSAIDFQLKLAVQRHFDVEVDDQEFPMRQRIFTELKKMNATTSLVGLTLAALSWLALAWGAIRLIRSLQG